MDDSPGLDDDEQSELRLLSRQELEQRVRRRTAALENVMDTMVDVLLKLDPEGRIQMANRPLETILGYEEEDVVGKPVDYVFASPEQNEQLADMMTKGELLDRLLSTGHVTDVEIYFETTGGEAIPMSLSASVMKADDGTLSGIVCVAKDIRERKRAEERAGFLHSLLRHDLGNKLQVIDGYLNLSRQTEGEAAEEHIDDALRGIREATELIEDVRTLNRIDGNPVLGPVDLAATITEAVARHEDLRKQKGVEVDNRVDGGVEVLAGSILKELFSNLVENALVHADASRIRISASQGRDEVVVSVEDDGTGIPDDRKERIFEKGVSGKGSSGSGLGMHLVQEIADTYGGDVTVRDSAMGGARFDVALQKA